MFSFPPVVVRREAGSFERPVSFSSPPSIGERPDQELLLADLPEPREAARFDDQEKNDERAYDDEAKMLDGVSADRNAERRKDCRQHDSENDGHDEDERRAEERADEAAQPS